MVLSSADASRIVEHALDQLDEDGDAHLRARLLALRASHEEPRLELELARRKLARLRRILCPDA